MALPALPPGFELEPPDPLDPLLAAGVQATNGFRTKADLERLRRQGYKPAANSDHLRGDGVDLVPGKSGWSLKKIAAEARRQFGPGATITVKGDHVHVSAPGWGNAPGTPGTARSGLPPLPDGFELEQRGSLAPGNVVTPTGEARDGDTIRLSTGQNGRVRGLDAWELAQQGRRPDNSLVPLGTDARDFLAERLDPRSPLSLTGRQSFGRPEVDLDQDTATSLLRHGHALAAPDYLQGDERFSPYMDAERLARANRLGGHGTNAETPEQFRRKDGPWQGAEPGKWGEGQAVFGDEPMPFMGLRPEIEQGYLAIALDPNSTAADLVAYATEHGFTIREEDAEKFIRKRNEGAEVTPKVIYERLPKPVTDVGDGALGAAVRGFGDPFFMLDEMGAVVDTLGGTTGRENIWNSDRRFGDVLWNNIDQNRSILAHDDMEHPYARFGGQVASAVALPYGAGVRAPMQLLKVGAAEGAAAGFGSAEGNPLERAPNTALGAGIGAAGGYTLGRLGQRIATDWRRLKDGGFGFRRGGSEAAEAVDDAAVIPRTADEAASQPREAAMRVDEPVPEVVGPPVRQRDYIDVEDMPPIPDGFVLEEPPIGRTAAMGERLAPDEMARLAEDVDPRSVLPRPANAIEDLSEAERANPGRFRLVEAPDEFDELAVRKIPSRKDFYRFTRVRGPLDMTQRIRTMGGIKDEGGNLAHLGVDGSPRRMEFGSNEQFLGKLIDNERGTSLDDMALQLWEEGYFPGFSTRPTIDDLIERLHAENIGAQRYFHPDDLEEVANFHSAQASRYQIEEAASEGRPFVDDVGETISLDDLLANTPPASAYEDAPRLTGKVGNINLNRLEKLEDVSTLIDQVSKRVGGFDAAARGRVTNEETRRLAAELGLRPEDLLKRRRGQALNAEQAYASRALVQRSRETVAKLAQKAVGGSDEDLATFRKAWLRHVGLEEQITGATAEAGRALQQFRMLASAQDAGAAAVRAYLKGNAGKETLEDAAEKIVDLMRDPARASHFMREAIKPKWRDKFNELWVNSLLSGPKTHVVNFVGNAVTTLMSLPEQALTVGIGKVLRSHDRARIGEVGARVAGMADGAVEGLKRARHAFATGEPLDAVTKVEAVDYHAIGGRAGKIIRIPTRALTASDEWWKAINATAELRALAYRQASRTTANPREWQRRYQELVRDPPEEMVKTAQNAARYYTFQKELGDSGKAIQRWANTWPGAKIILPFVRTPINLLKYAGERSVFAMAMPEVRTALKAGGRARDEALAKITLGSGLSTAAVMAALEGKVSGGGPADSRERAALLQTGWQPYSVRIGDEWVSYARFDPFSTLFGAAADFSEVGRFATNKEADEFAANLGMAIAKNVTSKTWLSGLSDAFEVLSDPERYGKSYLQRLAGSMAVPSVVNQAAQASDPYMRSARSIVDAIKARVPVVSETVPMRRDIWGEPVERGSSLGPDIASPIYTTRVSDDPVRQEIARLRVPLSMPQRYLKVRGQRFDLTPQQYDELMQLTGKPAKQYLDGFMQSEEWQKMPDSERVEFVQETLKEFRDIGREALKDRYPELSGGTRSTPPLPPGYVAE